MRVGALRMTTRLSSDTIALRGGKAVADKAIPSSPANASLPSLKAQHMRIARPKAAVSHPPTAALLRADEEFEQESNMRKLTTSVGSIGTSQSTTGDSYFMEHTGTPSESFTSAGQYVAAMIKAGKVGEAVEMASLWDTRAAHSRSPSRLARHRCFQNIASSVDALGEINDVDSLKALATVLAGAAQQPHHTSVTTAGPSVAVAANARDTTNGLFSLLGSSRCYHLLTTTVNCLIQSGQISPYESLAYLELTIRPTLCETGRVEEIVPLVLQASFHRQVRESGDSSGFSYDRRVAESKFGRVFAAFIHPSQLDAAQCLCLAPTEARDVLRCWDTGTDARGDAPSGELEKSKPTLLSILSVVRPRASASTTEVSKRTSRDRTITAKSNAELLKLLADTHSARGRSARRPPNTELRKRVLSVLRSPNLSVQRNVAQTLLRQRHLREALQISKSEVAVRLLCSFRHDVSSRPPSEGLRHLCEVLTTRLWRHGRYATAAQIAWNHLAAAGAWDRGSTKGSEQAAKSAALQTSCAAVCRAISADASAGRHHIWKGYRSLDLLRAYEGLVTPMHVLAVSAAALRAGVPFVAVQHLLDDVMGADAASRNWTLQMIRVCNAREDRAAPAADLRCSPLSCFFSKMRALVSQAAETGPLKSLMVTTPSRSRQLALWSLITDPGLPHQLTALATALFLDEAARERIIDGTCLLDDSVAVAGVGRSSPTSEAHLKSTTLTEQCDTVSPEMDVKEQPSTSAPAAQRELNNLFSWEVAASIASNCTTERQFCSTLASLHARSPFYAAAASPDGGIGGRSRIRFLLESELDHDGTVEEADVNHSGGGARHAEHLLSRGVTKTSTPPPSQPQRAVV